MGDEGLLWQAIDQPVEIVPYDPAWPGQYERERTRLLSLFPGTFFGIEHVGSTAVPGLAAKPLIDILAAVASLGVADALVPLLCQQGYTTSAEFNATLKGRRWLMRHAGGRRTHHLHLVPLDGEDWANRLRFRDLLRGDPGLAGRYAVLKSQLAAEVGSDREAYTNANAAFIEEALRGAG
jgi:GrpB-like predicted nucleotidyltransferase (UPF0157 family)